MVALNRFEGYPKHRWPLPTDPSGPPMAYPEPMPTYMPSMTPPATTAPPAAPTDTAYPPTGFQEPQQAPEASPEDDEFDRQIQEEQAEADWTRMTNRATAVLKVEADMQKARNALAEAKQKAMQRPSTEAPTEPLNKVFNRYVKGHAPMPTLEEYKAAVRRPAPTEVLGWTGRTGAPSGPGYRSYLEQGGTPEELEGITEENYRRALRENAPSPYIAPFQDLTFEEGRELVGKQREHREATMSPIREKLASISERRKELRRLRTPPTAREIMEHEKELQRIKTGQPTGEAPRYPRGHKLGVIDNEILELEAELEALGPKPSFWVRGDRYSKKEWQAKTDRITTRLNTLKAERRKIAGLTGGSKLTEDEARQILAEAGGDKEKARQIARQRGYSF